MRQAPARRPVWLVICALLMTAACGGDEGNDEPTDVVDTSADTRAPDTSDPDPDTGATDATDATDPDVEDPDVEAPDVDDATDATDPDSQDLDADDDADDDADAVVEAPIRDCAVEVVYEGSASAVTVAGAFNDWSTTMTPLTQSGGAWRTEVVLPPGEYAYKFVLDGQFEGAPPPDVYTQWDGDFENRNLIVPDCQRPEWRVVELEVGDDGTIRGAVQFVRAASGAPLDPDSVTLRVGEAEVSPTLSPSGLATFAYAAPAHGKYTVRLVGADVDGVAAENNPLYTPLWYEDEAFTWQDATLYLIFTDRFLDTDSVDRRIDGVEERANYLGGDFMGITQKIEEGYFDALGVNAIWISPIYDNTDQGYRDKRDASKLMSGFHGYWPISYAPEPRYGAGDLASADAALRELTRVAHAHGIRVLFDIALNHVHEDHPYCTINPSWCASTCQCGAPGCGWDPSERGLDCQFDVFLPDLSYRNHDLLEQVVADTLALLESYDVDGLRIDAARHMDHVIMRRLRMQLRDTVEARGGAPYYLVGETFTDDRSQIMDYVADHELHGQFDFAMRSAIRHVFGPDDGPMTALEGAAAASEAPSGYGRFVDAMSPFFGNHDIDRFATVIAQNDLGPWGDTLDLMDAGPDDAVDQWNIINRMSMAFAFLLTYRGVPLLYYGDEVGLAGSQDPDNRRPMHWDLNANQQELLARVQQLGQARRALPALRRGGRRELWQNNTFYVYVRDLAPGQAAIVAMNKGAAFSTEVSIPPELGLEGLTLQSFNSDRSVTVVNGSITVSLNPWEYAIFHTSTP